MVKWCLFLRFWVMVLLLSVASAWAAEQTGGIRGVISDQDFDVPLAAVEVTIVETGTKTTVTDEGNYVFNQVPAGTYTLIFAKEGYLRQVKPGVVVKAGAMTDQNAALAGDFTEMEEFIVQDIQLGGGTEAALLDLRMESPSLMSSISAELMSRAGASDAASALKLVSGATVQDGKYAVIRGLPDRYVNSQMNGVRLPTADTDKRAVQLDQFPSAVIESIQVSKTFTPDQQGDASGGAVNVVLKGIPEETVFSSSIETSFNTQVFGNDDFLTYHGGGVNWLGWDDRDIPSNGFFDESVGVTRGNAPIDYKWSQSAGGKYVFDNGVKIGGFGNVFYERDSSYYDDGVDDSYWVESPGSLMTPQYSQGTPSQGDFKTSLFDVTQASEEVQWGGLGVLGIETESSAYKFLYMYTRSAESTATLAEDTRGKAWYFPGYNPADSLDPGNQEPDAAPYLRTETLEYTERTTQTYQLSGRHTLPELEWTVENLFTFLSPEVDWGVSWNSATLYQPDKRQFGSLWWAESYDPGFPPWVPPSTTAAVHRPFKPAANFTLGNLQRTWKEIVEESNQYYVNLKLPFEQWTEDEGYMKFGIFSDSTTRDYDQDSFSNFNDNSAYYEGPWSDYWSRVFPYENHPVTAADIDVDYKGQQDISAAYYMLDVPVNSYFNIIGGARFEKTELSITNDAESDVTWIPPGATGPVALNPGDADVDFKQRDMLPSLGFEFTPFDPFTIRGSYSRTIARQTFKELTPIQQQEFLGGDVFIGNPGLQMSDLHNYDLRMDYTPYEGGLWSASYFYKYIENPIEYVQRNAGFTYTTPMNYPEGTISGVELEVRQKLEHLWTSLEGITVGANATLISSEVVLPDEEASQFSQPNINAPMSERDMTNAPEHIYNLFMTYDLKETGTQLGLFYTIQGDTLVAGAGQSNGKYIPSIYAREYGTLNFSLTQKLGDVWKLKFQAKNLLDPAIRTVYRSDYIGGDVTRSLYHRGIEFGIALMAEF